MQKRKNQTRTRWIQNRYDLCSVYIDALASVDDVHVEVKEATYSTPAWKWQCSFSASLVFPAAAADPVPLASS